MMHLYMPAPTILNMLANLRLMFFKNIQDDICKLAVESGVVILIISVVELLMSF